LCFVSLTNLMPLRTVEHVAFLRRKYEEIVKSPSASAEDKLFLHLEGGEIEFPGLFTRTMKEVQEGARRVLLFATALNLLEEQTDPRSGKRSLTFTEKDEFGVPVEATTYGDNILQACATIDGSKLRKLELPVDTKLRSEEFMHVDKKRELVGLVAKKLQDILALCGNSAQHPDYKAFSEAYQKIRSSLL
jgi:hypothetical protein